MPNINKTTLNKILFLDIETVPQSPHYNDLTDKRQKLWDKKAKYIAKEETAEESYSRAGIYAEFGKIICISFGYIKQEEDKKEIRIKSLYGDDEKDILIQFSKIINKHFSGAKSLLCAHNGKEFDFPYIARRCLINNIPVPKTLDTRGMKPWEVKHLDTLELWRFGDYKHYTSLELLTEIFNIPTPKDDIDGSMVGDIYWKERDIARIVEYCQKDVVAIIHLFCRYKNEELIENISFN